MPILLLPRFLSLRRYETVVQGRLTGDAGFSSKGQGDEKPRLCFTSRLFKELSSEVEFVIAKTIISSFLQEIVIIGTDSFHLCSNCASE